MVSSSPAAERLKVVFLVGSASPTSIPVEVAGHLNSSRTDVTVIPYYGPVPVTKSGAPRFMPLDASGILDMAAWRSLYRLLRELRPDVIHLNHTIPAFLGSLLGRLLRVPLIVVTEHHDHQDMSLLRAPVNLITFSLVDAIICNSDYTLNSFRWWERPICRRKCLTIYNGVDTELIDAGAAAANRNRGMLQPQDRLIIGNVGRLVREKDQETLIRAVALARINDPRLHLVIVGDGPHRSKLESLAHRLGILSSVTFTGELDRANVYEVLQTFDIFVMSSITEGFCNAVVEAMAACKPVIATHVGALPEVVGTTGWFVPAVDAAALARRIHEVSALVSDQIDVITCKARRRVEECFTVGQTAGKYEGLYRRELANKATVRD